MIGHNCNKKYTDKHQFNQASETTARGTLANTTTSKKKVHFQDDATADQEKIECQGYYWQYKE